jgi:hypothetical protein
MGTIITGTALGIIAAIWILVYSWAADPHLQAVLIFFTILGAARILSAATQREHEQDRFDA